MQINLELGEIIVGQRRRSLDPMFVDQLSESIKETGLLNPITIDGDNNLIAGMHRLEAVRKLGWKKIACHVIKGIDAIHAELAELVENLQRNELTTLERSEHLSRCREIYNELHPETTKGGDRKSDGEKSKRQIDVLISTPVFTENVSSQTGISQRTVQRDLEVVDAIPAEVRDTIRHHPIADNRTQLKALSELPVEQQTEVAEKLVSGEAKTVDQAVNGKREPKTHWDEIAKWSGAITRRVDEIAAAERLTKSPQHQNVLDAMQLLANAVKAFRRRVAN